MGDAVGVGAGVAVSRAGEGRIVVSVVFIGRGDAVGVTVGVDVGGGAASSLSPE